LAYTYTESNTSLLSHVCVFQHGSSVTVDGRQTAVLGELTCHSHRVDIMHQTAGITCVWYLHVDPNVWLWLMGHSPLYIPCCCWWY